MLLVNDGTFDNEDTITRYEVKNNISLQVERLDTIKCIEFELLADSVPH